MKNVLFVSAIGLGLLSMSPDAAAEFKCSCETRAVPMVEGYPDERLECTETYSGHEGNTSVRESHLKIFISDDNMVQGDKDMNIRFRPRDGKCLEQVNDGVAEKNIWMGAYCNNDSYKDLGQFKFEESKDQPGLWMAKFQAKTGGKDYNGFAMFTANGDKKYLQAACMDNK